MWATFYDYYNSEVGTWLTKAVLLLGIICGFPGNDNRVSIINYFVLQAKYYIYIQNIYSNNTEFRKIN